MPIMHIKIIFHREFSYTFREGVMKKFIAAFIAISFFSIQGAVAADETPREWDGKKIAKVSLVVKPDMMAGYNVQIKTLNFKWAPNHASMAHRKGEGHAHIYVDGVKIGRVYGEWYHLNVANLNLTPGEHTVLVNLNGNDHKPYAVDGKLLEAKGKITVK